MKVLVTGATGLVGKVVVKQLLEAGDEVVVLTRNVAKAAITLGSKCKYVQWSDSNSLPPSEAFDGIEGVINLMGENISAKGWGEEQKKKIYNSRIDSTARLVEAMSKLEVKPKVFASTSAVGIYGNRGSEEIKEDSSLGNDYLAHVCKDWEAEALKAEALGIRVAIIRVGVVLGRGGGMLSKLVPIFKMGMGGPAGSGEQFISWIHVEDLASMFIEAVKDSNYAGIYNGTAPYPASNRDFSKQLGKVLKRPSFAPVPAFAIRMMFGDMSTIVLDGQRVLPTKFKDKNFRYKYPTLEMALKETAY